MLKTSPNAKPEVPKAKLLHWQQKLLCARQRGLLHLQMQQQQGLLLAEAICQTLGLTPLWVHQEKPQSTNAIKQYIGQEFPAVVYNAYQHLSANHLALLAGTIKAGGLLIVVSDTQQNAINNNGPDKAPEFLHYWFDAMAKSPAVASFCQQGNVWHWPNLQALPKALHFDNAEQQQAINAIEKTVLGRAGAPLLLLAKRGRGKSAALGMAAASLVKNHNKNIIITGPSELAVKTLVKNYHQQTATPIHFWPMDKLLQQQPQCQGVFVDEATAIPISQLQCLMALYNRVVFASTIDGYEGSGQGFLLHFKPFLEKNFPKWRSCNMHQAIRFANNDGLENFIDNTFLLSAKVALNQGEVHRKKIIFKELTAKDLLASPSLLTKVFALLALAHYQTSADDLQFLLETPKARLFIASDAETVVGVLLTLDEGGFSDSDIAKLTKTPRRIPGHVLPQQLLAQGQENALALNYCRIIRIAVHPEYRRVNIASSLMRYLENNTNVDVIGSSFSATKAVLAFWQQAGFTMAMLGSKKSTASACYSVVCLRANNEAGEALVDVSAAQFQQFLPMQLLLYNHDIPAGCLPPLLQQAEVHLTKAEALQVAMFCEKRLGFEAAHQALAKQLRCYFQKGGGLAQEQYFLAEKLLLNKSFEVLAKTYPFSGRKAIEQAMREFFKRVPEL